MLKFFLALRYLRKRKIVFLSIAAVALSTALLVTVASLFTAFIGAIELSASEYLGDIVLEPPSRFSNYDVLIEKLGETAQIDSATPILSTSGLVHLGPGNVKAVNIWGIEPASRSQVTNFKSSLLRQKLSESEPRFEYGESKDIPIFIGIAVISEPDVKTDRYDFSAVEKSIGQKAVITIGTSEAESNEPMSLARGRSAGLVISDIVFTAAYDIDKKFVFMPIENLASLMFGSNQQNKTADVIHIKCADGVNPREAIETVRQIWMQFASGQLDWPEAIAAQAQIVTAVEKQAQYTAELRKQMGVLLVVFGIISAGIVVLIFCIFYMIVRAKQKDLAIIKSIGGSAGDIISIFLLFGSLVGLVGSAAGVFVGFIITSNVNVVEQFVSRLFGLKLWSSSVYMFTKIPNHFDWFWAVLFFIAAVAASILGAFLPSIIAAKTSPVKLLRYE
jgi:lipoprotein-releasing system permease protein